MGRIPKYRPRKDCDFAYVEMHGKRIGLPGAINSPESLAEYGRLVNEYLREKQQAHTRPPRRVSAVGLTITDLVGEWMAHCKAHYLGTANTTSNEYDNCRYAVRPLVAAFGGIQATRFTTDDFRELREAMISGAWDWELTAAKRKPRPWSRPMANGAINRIKRMFRWAVEFNRVPAEAAAPLLLLSPLEKGRSIAKETTPKGPVDPVHVEATLPYLQPIIRAMVELQRVTGLRSDNVTTLRPCDVDQAGDVWIYCPAAHKGTAQEKALAVAIGPKGKVILKPYLDRPTDAYCFSPKDATRKSRQPGPRYTTSSYRRGIQYGIRKANKKRKEGEAKIPFWHPHQLRHSWASEVRRKHNTESARVVLGHSHLKTTEIYAERDLALAVEIAREMG